MAREKVAERLLDVGFATSQLDQLIVLEEVQRILFEPKMIPSDTPPDWWIKGQFQIYADSWR